MMGLVSPPTRLSVLGSICPMKFELEREIRELRELLEYLSQNKNAKD